MSQNLKINLKYVSICILAVFLSFALHEGAHFLMGKALGYDMWMNLNSAGIVGDGKFNTGWEKQLVSAAGPIFTIIQGLIIFFIIKKSKNLMWYPFLFTCFLMRFFAAVISYIGQSNDEARISEWLGIGKMTLPLIVSAILLYFIVKTTKNNNISWKFNLITFILIAINISALVYINQVYF